MKLRKRPLVALMCLGLLTFLAAIIMVWGKVAERPPQALGELLAQAGICLLFAPAAPVVLASGNETAVHSPECSIEREGNAPLVGWSSIQAHLGKPLRLAGYGVWDFWKAPFQVQSSESDSAQEIIGDLLAMSSGQSVWVLVTLDTIGVPSVLAAKMRSAIRSEILGVPKFGSAGSGAAQCLVVTIVASHSHSSPDVTGIWGGAADSWNAARNQENMQEQVYDPLFAALRHAARAAVTDSYPARLAVDHDFYPTVARQERAAQGDNLTRVWIERDGAGVAEKDAVLWIWNGHAATDKLSEGLGKTGFGDFPAAARKALGSAVHSFFLPGVIAGDYPLEHEGWREELIGRVGQPPKLQPDSFSIRLRESDYCLAAESLLRRPLELWSSLGGGNGLSACNVGAAVGDGVAAVPFFDPHGAASTFSVRFQSIRIAIGEAQDAPALEIAFLPFEAFAAVESQIRPAIQTDLRLVSLANGFEGHGLALQQYEALMRGEREWERAKPYHLFLAMRSNIEDVTRNFLQAK